MDIVTDTHSIVWYFTNDPMLSKIHAICYILSLSSPQSHIDPLNGNSFLQLFKIGIARDNGGV
jgi:hypothetical protein